MPSPSISTLTADIPFYLEWLLCIWTILKFSWILLRKIQEELPSKFNIFFKNSSFLYINSHYFSSMNVSYYLFVLYPMISSVRLTAEDEFFSTYEHIKYSLTKTRTHTGLRAGRERTLSWYVFFLKITIKAKKYVLSA